MLFLATLALALSLLRAQPARLGAQGSRAAGTGPAARGA
jgi:hypothetical protein